jgi:peptidoglycan biosynthesis protein MviN/MurJ (putative lipid II flippase)
MRILAIILNVAFIGLIAFRSIGYIGYIYAWSREFWGVVIGGILVQVVNLFALLYGKPLERGYIRTYFKRKTIEEQAKLDALKKR